uniref:Interferon epsilon n=1 Tax=Aotus nancymaae TaxID=37293 RepID=A0A2K5DG54_AOTNA
MIIKHFFEILLVLLASTTIFSLDLKLVLLQRRRVNQESLKLFKLQTSSIQQCLQHRKNFMLPQKSVSSQQHRKGYTLAILHEMLQQIFSIFRANISLDSWEENHMEKFLIQLHQHLEYLEALMGLEAEKLSGTLGSDNLRLQVKIIRDYLENQDYSSCAWAIVRLNMEQKLTTESRSPG